VQIGAIPVFRSLSCYTQRDPELAETVKG